MLYKALFSFLVSLSLFYTLNAIAPKLEPWKPIKVEATKASIAEAEKELAKRKNLVESESNNDVKIELGKRYAHDEATLKLKRAELDHATEAQNPSSKYGEVQKALETALREQQEKTNALEDTDKQSLGRAGINPQLITPPMPPTEAMRLINNDINRGIDKIKEDTVLSDQEVADLSGQIDNNKALFAEKYSLDTLQKEVDDPKKTQAKKVDTLLTAASYAADQHAAIEQHMLEIQDAQTRISRKIEDRVLSDAEVLQARKQIRQYDELYEKLKDTFDVIEESMGSLDTLLQKPLAQETTIFQQALQAIKEWAEDFANFFSGNDAHLLESSRRVDRLLSGREESLKKSQRMLLQLEVAKDKTILDSITQEITNEGYNLLTTADTTLGLMRTSPDPESNRQYIKDIKLGERLKEAKSRTEFSLEKIDIDYEALVKDYETPLIEIESLIRKFRESDPSLFQHLLKEYERKFSQLRTGHQAQKYLFTDAVLLEMAKDPSVNPADIAALKDPLLYRSDTYPAIIERNVRKALDIASKIYNTEPSQYQDAYNAYIILRDPDYYKFLKEYDRVALVADPYSNELPNDIMIYLNDRTNNPLAQQEIDEYTQGLLKDYHVELRNIEKSLYPVTKQVREIKGAQQLLVELLDAKIAEFDALGLG